MATTSSISLTTRTSLPRPIALGGMFIFIAQLIHSWIVPSLIQKNPFIVVLQYIVSGALGSAAFEGGIATALLGVLIFLESYVQAITDVALSRPRGAGRPRLAERPWLNRQGSQTAEGSQG